MKTFGEYFKEVGYSTYFFGKWHLGLEYLDLLPNSRGYDYFYGSIGGVINHYDKQIGLACGEPGDQFSNIYGVKDCKLLNGYDLQENGIPFIEQETYNSILQANKATEIISLHNSSIPMLMHYHPNEPHAPLQVESLSFSLSLSLCLHFLLIFFVLYFIVLFCRSLKSSIIYVMVLVYLNQIFHHVIFKFFVVW